MASKNPDIMVDIGANLELLQKGLSNGAKSISDFAGKISTPLRDATDKIAKVGAAAGVAAAGGLLAMTKSATAAGRELKIFSQISNTSIQEFQNLSSAAAQFGITNEKLADQLKDVKDRVGDFLATGGGAMADFFENVAPKVGVTAEQFKNLSGAQSLQLYISSLEKANLSQSEMTFYLEAMASDLTQLAPLFANNGKLISENEKRLREMGLALSDLEVMQLEEGAKAFAQMQESASAAANVIGAKLSPFVVEAMNQLNEAGKAGGDFGENVDKAIQFAIKSVGFFADTLHGVKVSFAGLKLAGEGLGVAIVSIFEGAIRSVTRYVDVAIMGVNATINALNKLPKVDIANIDPFSESAFVKGINGIGEAARYNLGIAAQEFQALAMVELPSENIEKFLNNVIEKSQKAAEVAKAAHNEMIAPPVQEEGSEQQDAYSEKVQDFNNFLNQKLGMQKAYNDSVSGLINKQWGEAASGTAGAMKSILGTMSTQSRKAFEISKAWAIGDAVVSTAQGIAAGVRLGWPMGIPAVAWATATGLAQINQIKNQKFGGAGGAAAAGNGTPATAPNPIGVGGVTGGSGGAQSGQTLTLSPIDPNALFSGANVQMLAKRLSDFAADGGTIVMA